MAWALPAREAAKVLVGCPPRGASYLASCISEAARGCPDFVAGSGFAKPSIIGYWPLPVSGESYMTVQLISGPAGALRVALNRGVDHSLWWGPGDGGRHGLCAPPL